MHSCSLIRNFGNNDKDDFRIVSGILRLSTKYIIDSLRSKAIAHLSIAWPLTLKAWDAREDLARSCDTETLYPSPIVRFFPSHCRVLELTGSEQEVINLAREVDVASLLPSAFYDLSRHPFSQIFEPAEDDRLYVAPSSMSPSTQLSPSDMQKLALGKESSHNHITNLIRAMGSISYLRPSPIQQHHSPHPSGIHSHPRGHARRASSMINARPICVSPSACRKDFSELVDLATQHYLFDKERGCMDPLYVAEELGQLKSGGAEFSECKPCAAQLEIWASRERERMWKLVPSWFRLEGSTDSVIK
jgi:hypothetical protein